MGLINWIFDIYQHSKIDDARREAAEAREELRLLRHGGVGFDRTRIPPVVEELALATKALQRILVEKGVCTADEFARMVRAIDLEDGVEDYKRRLL